VDLAGDARLLESKVVRQMLPPSERPEAIDAIDERLREVAARLERLRATTGLVKDQLKWIDFTAGLSLGEFAEDCSWSRSEPDVWSQKLGDIASRADELEARLTELLGQEEDLVYEEGDLRSRRAAVATPADERRTCIVLRVEAEQAAEVEIRIDYLVPGACWRPWHRASLSEGALAFTSQACVWQNTGEDWQDVQLHFSTERASLGVAPPELYEDLLQARKVGSEVKIAVRQETVKEAGLGSSQPTSPEVPGIDDGGEPTRLSASARATVPSDGRPHRFGVFEFDGPSKLERILMAELSDGVLLRSEQVNNAAYPLLPGPVDLVRDRGVVGRTDIEFVAPGERFELGWGPDLSLRTHREHAREELERKLMSSWTTTKHRIRVRLSNIGSEEVALEVKERIPVSEVEKVKVEFETAEPGAKPDGDGFLSWDVVLAPYGTSEIALDYAMKQHSDVVS
jgi:uncharacterized protein (TIGR02231 family)